MRGFGYRQQAFHQDLDHARQEHHGGSQRHARLQHLGDDGSEIAGVVVADCAQHQADDEAENDRLPEYAEALFDGLRGDVDPVDAGDALDDPVDDDGDRQDLRRRKMRDGNTGHAVELLDRARRPVGEEQAERGHQRRDHQSVTQAAGGCGRERADESEMPEVPDVDIERAGHFGEQQHDVDGDGDRDDPEAHRRAEGDRRGRRPADIDDIAMDARIGDDGLRHVADGAQHQAQHKVDADECDADGDGGAERLAGLGAENDSYDEDNDGQQHRCAQSVDGSLQAAQKCVHDFPPDGLATVHREHLSITLHKSRMSQQTCQFAGFGISTGASVVSACQATLQSTPVSAQFHPLYVG